MSISSYSFRQSLQSMGETQLLYGIKTLNQEYRYNAQNILLSRHTEIIDQKQANCILKKIRKAKEKEYVGSNVIVSFVLGILNFLGLRISSAYLIELINSNNNTSIPTSTKTNINSQNLVTPFTKDASTLPLDHLIHLSPRKQAKENVQTPKKSFTPSKLTKTESTPSSSKINNDVKNDLALLFSAIRNHDMHAFNLLLKRAVNINQTFKGITPLHCTAILGNEQFAKLLLKANANINAVDELGNTALAHAALNDHLNIVKLLLNHGSDISNVFNVKPLGNSTIECCAILGRSKVVDVLLENGAKKISDPNEAFSFYKSLKTFRPVNHKDLYTKLSDVPLNQQLIQTAQHHLRAQSVAHAFEIDGKLNAGPNEIELLGNHSQYWIAKILKSANLIHKHYPDVLPEDLYQLMVESMEFALNHVIDGLSNYERISQIKPTFLITGYGTHTVIIFIWGSLLAVSDLNNPVEIHYFNQNNLTPEIVKSFLTPDKADNESFDEFLYDLYVKLEIYEKNEDEVEFILENSSPFSHLNVGNCSYANFEAALWVFFQFYRLNKLPNEDTISDKDLNTIIQEETKRFFFIKHFNQAYHLERYLGTRIIRQKKDNNDDPIYKLDESFIKKAFDHFSLNEADNRIVKIFEQLKVNPH